MNISDCTLTGVDESTSLADITDISVEFPIVEWGFLYSPKRQGRPSRYPSVSVLGRAFQDLPAHVRVSMHVCGDGVHNLLAGKHIELELLDLIASRHGRVQLNFNQARKPIDLGDLKGLLTAYPATTFITQHNKANESVWQTVAENHPANHAVLFDASGGNGIVCDIWPKPLPIACGYAGGLGPDNIAAELNRIAAVAGARTIWIDMEGKLRRLDNGWDWLDLAACCACLRVAQSAGSPVASVELDYV